jgi:hypothetical protein
VKTEILQNMQAVSVRAEGLSTSSRGVRYSVACDKFVAVADSQRRIVASALAPSPTTSRRSTVLT